MENGFLLGIDIGTSSTKTVILSYDGRLLSQATRAYSFRIPKTGWAEQDPQTWFIAARDTVRQAIEEVRLEPEQVSAIGITGLMHGPVFLDSEGNSLRPSILWADQRSTAEVQKINEELGKARITRMTGNPIATGFMLPTWLWMANNEPEILDKTHCLLLPKDYLRFRFTAEFGTEHSDASATSLYDPFLRQWSTELLHTYSLPTRQLPTISASHKIAGGLTRKTAEEMKLKAGTPVVFGGSDQACQAIGNGIINPNLLSCTIGTGGQLFAMVQEPKSDPHLRIHLFHHAIPETWHFLAATLTAGKSLQWLRDSIFPGSSYQDLVQEASQVSPGADGLTFLPYLTGERTPHLDPSATAGFLGLTLSHTRAHLVRAVMEGVVMSIKQGLEILLSLGVKPNKVIASGGAVKHPLWLQLQADIFNYPICQTAVQETGAVGAALLAGVGSGVYKSFEEACNAAVQWKEEIYEPDQRRSAVYHEQYQHFRTRYPAMKKAQSKG